MPRVRYDYRCACGHECVLTMSMNASPTPRKCPSCQKRQLRRCVGLGEACTAAIAYQNRFPYVSNAFPFGGVGATHVGPLKKCLVESKAQEDQLRAIHGYVGEKGVG